MGRVFDFCHQGEELTELDLVLVGEDLDKVDKRKNSADSAKEAEYDLHNSSLLLAHYKVMNADSTKEEANQRHSYLILTVKLFGSLLLLGFERATAAYANDRIRIYGLTAGLAEAIALARLNAALQADRLLVIHLLSTALTIHSKSSNVVFIIPKWNYKYYNSNTEFCQGFFDI